MSTSSAESGALALIDSVAFQSGQVFRYSSIPDSSWYERMGLDRVPIKPSVCPTGSSAPGKE